MTRPLVKTQCVSCGYYKDYPFEDFAGSEQEVCAICGSSLNILNLEEVKEEQFIESRKSNIQAVFRAMGIEGAIELIEAYPDTDLKKLYIKVLQRHFPQLKVRQDAE